MEKSIEVLKGFEKKDKVMMGRVATNISFLYFLETDFKNAEKFAEEAITYDNRTLAIDPNNSSALYNKSLALAGLGRLKESLAYYSKALDIDSNSIITPNNNDSILDSIRH